MRKTFLALAAFWLVCVCAAQARATANYVYHEQTNNFVATPAASDPPHCSGPTTITSCGRYVENTDRSPSGGFQVYSTETYTLHFKIEYQNYTTQVRVYYTTDGTRPCGSFGAVGNVTQPNGTPCGLSNTTQVAVASYTCTYSDMNRGCAIVDVATGSIPPQPAGTTVNYLVSAWHQDGGNEIFANSGDCCGGFTSSSQATLFSYNVLALPAVPLVISEFRLRGPGPSPTPTGTQKANDEFVEIYNSGSTEVVVNTIDGSAGYAVAASDGVPRFYIPNGTRIPPRGHYLGVNSTGYSLGGYPAGDGTTATGDATYADDIADNAGLALFRTADPANFTLANRLDAVGSTSEANALYKEGAGYPALGGATYFSGIDYSFYRDTCGKGGSTTVLGNCTPGGGLPKDTDDNAADFVFVDTNATAAGAGQRLGAPGPENMSSPIQRNNFFGVSNIDPAVSSASEPNRVRDTRPDAANNSTYGTLAFNRTITNNTGRNVTRLRFRIIDLSTSPVPSGYADLRARTSGTTTVTIAGSNPACVATLCVVQGTTLETPPAQPIGGGFNSTLSADTVTLLTPLKPGDKINVQLLLGLQSTGTFKFLFNVEALP